METQPCSNRGRKLGWGGDGRINKDDLDPCFLDGWMWPIPVLAVWVWGNAEKVLRETPPSCSNLPTKSFPFSEKVFMPPSPWGKVASLIFRPGYGQYGTWEEGRRTE